MFTRPRRFSRKVVILIDEYDVPLDKAFQTGYHDQMVSLIRNLLGNALKTNQYLELAVLTGCMRISKGSIFTGLNNMNVMSIVNEYFLLGNHQWKRHGAPLYPQSKPADQK